MKHGRIDSYKTVLAALLALVVLVGGFWSWPHRVSAAPDHITLTWSGDVRTTQTITWRSPDGAATGSVEVKEGNGQAGWQGSRLVAAEASLLAGQWPLYSATLSGLKPGTRYQYRVGSGDSWSETLTFVTAPAGEQPFRFLVFGDSQSYRYSVWGQTLHNAYQAQPDAAFFLNVGDLVDNGQSLNEWEGWFSGARGVVDAIPVVPVVGNHETYTPERTFSMPVFFTAQLKVPQNGPEGLKGQVYSFDYGNVHFVVLDTQWGEERAFVPDMLEWQKAWLAKDLAATHKRWKVVAMHRPFYHNRAKDGDGHLRAAFAPLFDQYQVDLVLTGHDHVYARTQPLAGGEAVVPPQHGTVYMATGRSGTKSYPNQVAKEWNVVFHNPVERPMYLTVEVTAGALHVRAYEDNGRLLDDWSLVK